MGTLSHENKEKSTIKELTKGKCYSLHDASEELGITKREIMEAVRAHGMTIKILFSKFTVLTHSQVSTIAEEFGVTSRLSVPHLAS